MDGELVSDTARPRGAIAVTIEDQVTRLLFDVVTAEARVRFGNDDDAPSVEIAGIDTTRQRGRLMLFTPNTTLTPILQLAASSGSWVARRWLFASGATTWEARQSRLRDSCCLYGGLDPPAELEAVKVGDPVKLERRFVTRHGTPPARWAAADHVIGGAGLLARDGQYITDWAVEDLRGGFATDRHPRTMVGVDRDGDIWLVTVDGRNPQISLGMTFVELQRLAARLKLTDVLNLDGGGSTTMVVKGAIVNHPSDTAGPRKVSDSLIVIGR